MTAEAFSLSGIAELPVGAMFTQEALARIRTDVRHATLDTFTSYAICQALTDRNIMTPAGGSYSKQAAKVCAHCPLPIKTLCVEDAFLHGGDLPGFRAGLSERQLLARFQKSAYWQARWHPARLAKKAANADSEPEMTSVPTTLEAPADPIAIDMVGLQPEAA